MSELFKALDLSPTNIVEDKKEIINLEEIPDDLQVEEDIDYVRENLKEIIETGKGALESISNIANQSQHPRAFEVLNGILKTLSDVNKDLLEMHQRKKALKNSVYEGPSTVHQHLTLTTADLNRMIEEAHNKKSE